MKSYKTELKLNNRQRTACEQHAGAARFAYNWALEKRQKSWKDSKKSLSYPELHKELNKLKETKEYKWLYDVSKCAPQEAIRNLDKAYQNFFRRVKENKQRKARKQKVKKVGFPKFKKKSSSRQSFRLTGSIKIFDNCVQLPRLGKLKVYEKSYIPKDEHILSATVSKEGNKWFVAINTKPKSEVNFYKDKPENIAGIDLGIKTLATCSDGTIVDNPRALKRNSKKLRKCHKAVSRKKKGSKNREKAKVELRKVYQRVLNIRKDNIEKSTTSIAKKFSMVCLETLNVEAMKKNRKLSKAVSDASMRMFRTCLERKQDKYNCKVVYADRFYPSSKTCSNCGVVKDELKLSERIFNCFDCGFELDRDLNASINLKNVALGYNVHVAPSSEETKLDESPMENACGDDVRLSLIGEQLSVKQEKDKDFNRNVKIL